MSLDDDIFLQMVALLHHLGLACPMHLDSSDESNLLVPWFLNDYPEPAQLMSTSLPKDQVLTEMCALYEQNLVLILTMNVSSRKDPVFVLSSNSCPAPPPPPTFSLFWFCNLKIHMS